MKHFSVYYSNKVNCIQVDDTAKAKTHSNWSVQTSESVYSTNCFGGSLAIKFINILATKTSIGNKISWSVGNDDNIENYTIQQSNNGRDFSNIANIAIGNRTTYNYIAQSTTNRVYYRIIATEKGGTISYSEIMSLDNSQSLLVNVYPNPATSFINIESNGAKKLIITDCFGRIIQQLNNITEHQIINTKQWSNGIYIFSFDTGEKVKVIKE